MVVLQEYGVWAPLLRLVLSPLLRLVLSLYGRSRHLVCIASSKSDLLDSGRAALSHWFCSLFSWTAYSSRLENVACPLQVAGEVLPQVEEFKNFGIMFTGERKMECKINR